MARLCIGRFKKNRKNEIEKAAKAAQAVHKNNIKKIVKSREPSYELIKEIKHNHIIIELAKAMGH